MGFKKWCVAEFDKDLAKNLAEECDVDAIVALIASSRGYTDPMDLEQFLSDEPFFTDPKETADIILAADIINAAIENGTKIAVYGDYDCDGVTATAMFYTYLKSRNADCIYYIPDRFTEGYGMNCDAVKKLHEDGVKLIVTVDNGIACIEEIELASSLGMEVIVTDHHLPGDVLPNAAAVVDPHRKDCPSEFKSICGAEVAFRLMCVMENREPEELLPYFADILSVAVIADIMPLTHENRSIVKYGIHKLRTNPLTGLKALMNVAAIEQNTVNSTRIAFGISPRINAAGRMGSAARAVELLCTDNIMTALSIANEIDGDNAARQQTEKKIFEEAVHIIESQGLMYHRVIVAAGENWHHGVIGIVAAKITERYGCPAILLSSDGELAVGSGRSIEGFSLFDAISYAKDLTVKFGGHESAAGLTIKAEDVTEFREKINSYADSLPPVFPRLQLDCKLRPSALNLDLADAVNQLEPFGTDNKTPLFGIYGVTLQRITPIGNNKHLRLLVSKDTTTVQCLLFGVTPESFCFEVGDILDLAVTVDKNYYKGEYSLSVQVKAVRMSGTDDDRLFADITLYNDYSAGKKVDYSLLLPTRAEVGEIYKLICEKRVSKDRINYRFINSIGFAKTTVAVKALEELGLITKDTQGFYKGVTTAEKTNLMNSQTYKQLSDKERHT